MALQMTNDKLEGGNTKQNYKGRDVEYLVKLFKYHQPFGLNFGYCYQVKYEPLSYLTEKDMAYQAFSVS